MSTTNNQTSISVYDIIEEMKKNKMYFYLISTLPYAITICIALPGQRIEIDVFENGLIYIAHFSGEEVSDISLDDVYKMISE